MNDLRSRNRTLAPVPSIGPKTGEIVSSRPARRPPGNPLFQSSRPAGDHGDAEQPHGTPGGAHVPDGETGDPEPEERLTFKVSRELRTMPVSAVADGGLPDEPVESSGPHENDDPANADRVRGRRKDKGPASRPTKRREVFDADTAQDDKFPWHYQFDEDDEPEELQAKSPLLSRAFRSSVG